MTIGDTSQACVTCFSEFPITVLAEQICWQLNDALFSKRKTQGFLPSLK